MEESAIKYIFLFLLGTSVLNFAIALLARLKTKNQEFTPLVFYWPAIILTYMAAATLSANPTQIAFAYFFQIISSNLIVEIMCSSQGISFRWRNYLLLQALAMLGSSYLLLKTQVGFTLSLIPICTAFSLPFIKPIWHALVRNRTHSSWIEKFMALIFITGVIHHFNYAFFRLVPDAAFWGWGVSIAQYQCLSVLLPLLINYRREQNEKKNLQQVIEKLSGQKQVPADRNELYSQLELQISQKELLTKQLQEEREINEVLIRTISHDLANPLTIVAAYIEMLHGGRIPPEESEKTWKRLKVNTQAALEMVARIRNAIITRNEASLLTIKDVSIHASLERAVEMFELRLKEKNLKVSIDNPLPPEVRVLAEEHALCEHVFANVLSNAIKFSFPENEIQIKLTEDEQMINVEFRDFGTGMRLKEQPQRQLSSLPGTQGELGSGFGFMVMGYFLRKFNARMEIKSQTEGEERGTRILIKLKKFPISAKNHELPAFK